jgi:hypothetical protein
VNGLIGQQTASFTGDGIRERDPVTSGAEEIVGRNASK